MKSKKSTLVRIGVVLAAAAVATVLQACNTVEGAGQDIERGGEKLQDAADRNR